MATLAHADGPILEQILDATFPIWHDDLDRRAYGRFWAAQTATSWGRSHLDRYALVDRGEVLASAKLYTFDAALDTRRIQLAGLGAVFTQPAHRRRGAARELIERLLARAAEAGADAALLFSEIGADYYAALGFTPIATELASLRVVEDARRGAPATMVRGGEERDLADVAAMCALRAAPFRFHLNRDRSLVQFAIARKRLRAGLGPPGRRELQFFIAEEGASAAAYAVVTVDGGEWRIEEFGDRDPGGARIGALLQVLVARDPSAPRPPIRAWLPHGFCPPQVRIVDRAPSPELMMVRALTDAGRAASSLREADVLYWLGDRF